MAHGLKEELLWLRDAGQKRVNERIGGNGDERKGTDAGQGRWQTWSLSSGAGGQIQILEALGSTRKRPTSCLFDLVPLAAFLLWCLRGKGSDLTWYDVLYGGRFEIHSSLGSHRVKTHVAGHACLL